MWVFDAIPLIYIAKIEQLDLLQHFEATCVIPERMYEEVVTSGLEQGYPDVRCIERSVKTDQFDMVAVSNTPVMSRLQRNAQLSDANVVILTCAVSNDGVAVRDEPYERDVATAEGITTRGTAHLILLLVKKYMIHVDEARTAIDAMIDEG